MLENIRPVLISSVLVNGLFLFDQEGLSRLFRAPVRDEPGLLHLARSFYARQPREMSHLAGRIERDEALLAFAVLLWRVKYEGLEWDEHSSRLVSSWELASFYSHIMNPLRVGYPLRDQIPEIDVLLDGWPAAYEEVEKQFRYDNGLTGSMDDEIGWQLCTYMPCVADTSLYPRIRASIESWLENPEATFQSIRWDIGCILLVLYEYGFSSEKAWRFVTKYVGDRDSDWAVTGFDVAGVIAGQRLFGSRIRTIIESIGFGADATSLAAVLSECFEPEHLE